MEGHRGCGLASVRCAGVRWPGFVQVVMRVLVLDQVGQVEPLQLQLVRLVNSALELRHSSTTLNIAEGVRV